MNALGKCAWCAIAAAGLLGSGCDEEKRSRPPILDETQSVARNVAPPPSGSTTECLNDSWQQCAESSELKDFDEPGPPTRGCYRETKRAHLPWQRHGPSIWYHDANSKQPARAGNYYKHKKEGRWFYFDPAGNLRAIKDWHEDQLDGAHIDCNEQGQVLAVSHYRKNAVHGISAHFAPDRQPLYAFRHDNGGHGEELSPTETKTLSLPAKLCQPSVCPADAIPTPVFTDPPKSD